jgi:DNA adenine methylase
VKGPTRPVMRYFGGKWRLAHFVISHFPVHNCYVEPFGGAGSVLMQKQRSKSEFFNDLDGEVVNVFKVLRDLRKAARLEELIRLTPYSRKDFDQAYIPVKDPIEQARRTILKSYAGFGSDSMHRNVGMRTRASTHPEHIHAPTGFRTIVRRNRGTTPAKDWSEYPDQIRAFCERLQGVVIECRPALKLIAQLDSEETLFYVDPPYPMSSRMRPGHGYAFEMTDEDHRELASALFQIKGMVLLSSYRSELYSELYSSWRSAETRSRTNGNHMATEILWMSPNVPARHKELFDHSSSSS